MPGWVRGERCRHHPVLAELAEDPALLNVIRGMLITAGAPAESVDQLEAIHTPGHHSLPQVFQSLALLKPQVRGL